MALINSDRTKFDTLISQNNLSQAFKYAKDIADKEIPWAQYEVGNMYLLGQGVEKNDVMGLFYIGEAADYGNYAPAQYVVGKFYLHGIGLSRDNPTNKRLLVFSSHSLKSTSVKTTASAHWPLNLNKLSRNNLPLVQLGTPLSV